jgi:hypothetical protein
MQMVASFTKDVVKLHVLFFVQHCLDNTHPANIAFIP